MATSTILYILWYFWGILYFIMGFWALLEKAGKSHKIQDPNEMFKQGVFLTLVVYRLALFPALLAVGASVAGPSKPITIKAANNKHKKK
jgi:hypothetical protein